jgi:hypothetical protein
MTEIPTGINRQEKGEEDASEDADEIPTGINEQEEEKEAPARTRTNGNQQA